MIFLTVGTQLPFDRLVETLDRVASDLHEQLFAQTGSGTYYPKHFAAVDRLDPRAFHEKFQAARVIVGHAGIGTVLTGRKFCKPLVLMARRASLGEHRNDHQIATASQLSRVEGVFLFETDAELKDLLSRPILTPMSSRSPAALEELRANLRNECFGLGEAG